MRQKNVGKLAVFSMAASVLVLANPGLAFAHVVVTPKDTLTGAYETFTTSVPNEKDVPVTGLRLVIPDTIESVTPTVKPGWEIQTKKSGDKVTEINWTGGTIAPELRDTFTFSAHMPAKAGEIDWKAYQTYQDGSVVSWDQKPVESEHHGEDKDKGPYSTTTVADKADGETGSESQNNSMDIVPYVVSVAALALSVFTLVGSAKK